MMMTTTTTWPRLANVTRQSRQLPLRSAPRQPDQAAPARRAQSVARTMDQIDLAQIEQALRLVLDWHARDPLTGRKRAKLHELSD